MILVVVSWTFFTFASILYIMRIYADCFILESLRVDSFINFLAFVSTLMIGCRLWTGSSNNKSQLVLLTSQVFVMLSVYHGMGQHIRSLNTIQIMYSLKWGWIAQILQLLANTISKLAFITLLAKFKRSKARITCLWTLGLLQVTSVVVLIAFILTQCSPVHKLWNEGTPGTCNGRIRNEHFAFFQGSK